MTRNQCVVAGGVAMLTGAVSASAQEAAPLFKVGSVDIRPRASYSLVYDDNIFLEHKDHLAGRGNPGRDHDWISTITPGLRLNAGDAAARQATYFDANYDASIIRFANFSGSDAVDHNANVAFGGHLNRLGLKISQGLTSASDADVHTLSANGRVQRKIWDTKVGATYEVSEKTSASLDFAQTIGVYAAPLVDTAERSGNAWLDYQVLPKVKMGAGVGGGYLQVDNTAANVNPNSVYFNGQIRLDWQATEKVSIQANGGMESRHYQGQNVSDPVRVIFGLGARWQAAERTALQLSASRGVKPSSANGNTVNEETSITIGIKHALASDVSMSLDAGYSISHYTSSTGSAATLAAGSVHDDNYYFLKPGISYRFAERAQASVYYQYRRNNADLAANGNDFYSNQLGVELSYRF